MQVLDVARPGRAQWMAAGLVLLALMVVQCDPALATDGDLDLTFGTGGFTLAGLTGATFILPPKPVVQPDGKILYCSGLSSGGISGEDFVVLRFNADGSPDSSFNFDGRAIVDFSGQQDLCNALAVQADGKIVAAGSTAASGPNQDFAVARLNTDGSLDSTFGAGTGKTIIAFDLGDTNSDQGTAVALQPDGKIVVAGWADTAMHGDDFAVVRLLPDGSRDTAFNVTGRVTVGFDFPGGNESDEADTVIIDDAGRIVVAGAAVNSADDSDFAVIRLLPNGQLDPEFDGDGRATIGFDLGATNNDPSYQTILQRDGKIVMVGQADTGSGSTSNDDTAIARLLPDGSPDASFGIGGKVLVPYDLVANGTDVGWGVVQDEAGRLLVAGAAMNATGVVAVVSRLNANGSLDASFGAFGKKVIDLGGDGSAFTGVALQGTQIIGAGERVIGSDTDDLVARLNVDLIFADGFE